MNPQNFNETNPVYSSVEHKNNTVNSCPLIKMSSILRYNY